MRIKRSLIILSTLFYVSTISFAQRVTNVRAQMDGDYVKILYDLDGTAPSDLFEVKLFASNTNFTEPLKMITGEVGKGIKPGKDHVIIWRAQEELVNFRGEIVFEIRATLMGGYYTVTNPSSASKFKRGKLMPINWQGGEPNERVKIELMVGTTPVTTISEAIGNQGSFIWTIPKKTKPNKAYQVKISNINDYASQGISKSFKLKGGSKAPLILIPLLAGAGVGAYLFLGGEEDEPETPVVTDQTLPRPPQPSR